MLEADWLSFLEAWSEPRPLLVQHSKTDRWHRWPCGHPEPVYTRNLIPNEVLFECDDPPANTPEGWRVQREQFLKFAWFLEASSIPHVLAYSGSKGFHLHLFFNAWWVPRDDGVGMFAARIALFRELPRRAGVSLAFDRTNMSWYDLERKGRMVREFLSRKEGGLPKTFVGQNIPEARPPFYHGRYPPEEPGIWDASLLRAEMDEATAEARRVEERKVNLEGYVPDGKWQGLIGASWLLPGEMWEPGSRYIRGRTAARAMLTAGVPLERAHLELSALESHVADRSYDFYRWHDEADRIYEDGDGLTYWFPPPKSVVDDALAGAGL
jgi:hypothetical protein